MDEQSFGIPVGSEAHRGRRGFVLLVRHDTGAGISVAWAPRQSDCVRRRQRCHNQHWQKTWAVFTSASSSRSPVAKPDSHRQRPTTERTKTAIEALGYRARYLRPSATPHRLAPHRTAPAFSTLRSRYHQPLIAIALLQLLSRLELEGVARTHRRRHGPVTHIHISHTHATAAPPSI